VCGGKSKLLFFITINSRRGSVDLVQFLVSHKYKFLLGWSAKCGCSSVKKWYLDVHNIKLPADGNTHKLIGYGDTEFSNIDWGRPERYQNYGKFLVVRDPYRRLVSGFVNKYVNDEFKTDGWGSFAEFLAILANDTEFERIDLHHFPPQFTEEYSQFSQHFSFDFTARLEHLQVGLDTISKTTGAPKPNAGVVNKSKYAPFAEPTKDISIWSMERLKKHWGNLPHPDKFYTHSLIKQVEVIYKKDFESLKQLGIEYMRPRLVECSAPF